MADKIEKNKSNPADRLSETYVTVCSFCRKMYNPNTNTWKEIKLPIRVHITYTQCPDCHRTED